MKKQHTFRPTPLDGLEDRVVLSLGSLAPAHLAAAAVTPPIKQVLDLHGTVKGFITPSPLASLAGNYLFLNGKGTVTPLGQVGTVALLSIQSGEPTFYDGRVALYNSRGGVLIHVSGIVGGPSGPPARLHYQIMLGWGAFQGATGKGVVIYNQPPTAGPRATFSLEFGPASTPIATS